MLIIKRTTSDDSDFIFLTEKLDSDLNSRYGIIQETYNKHNKISLIETALVAYFGKKPVGCACFKKYSEDTIEIKRMFVVKEARGKRIGAQLLSELENWAFEQNYTSAILETGKQQPEAINLYLKSGYTIIENYGQYKEIDNSICMSKSLKPLL